MCKRDGHRKRRARAVSSGQLHPYLAFVCWSYIMRLWTLHPRYLDTKGLLAAWREGLLAQKVLQTQTIGYRHPPQLRRFRSAPDPLAAISMYLRGIYEEASHRGYRFGADKIVQDTSDIRIPCTRGQLLYEWNHLQDKLRRRDPARYQQMEGISEPEPHPLFQLVEGDIEDWERNIETR